MQAQFVAHVQRVQAGIRADQGGTSAARCSPSAASLDAEASRAGASPRGTGSVTVSVAAVVEGCAGWAGVAVAIVAAGEVLCQAAKEAAKEAQAQAVKLEGATELNLEIVRRLVGMGIPVMGHLGFTPQSIHGFGGTKVQGKSAREAAKLVQDSLALEDAGVFSLVLEMVPDKVAQIISEKLSIPTVGIGAGNACDGQILVTDDMLGISGFYPKFVKKYANLNRIIEKAVKKYTSEVKAEIFPSNKNFLNGPQS